MSENGDETKNRPAAVTLSFIFHCCNWFLKDGPVTVIVDYICTPLHSPTVR